MERELQALLDRLSATSWQRWLLIGTAITAMIGVAAATDAAAGGQAAAVAPLLAVVMGFVAAVRPDSTAGTIAIALVLLHWVVNIDDPTTGWTIVAGIGLVTFHTALAAMAVTPIAVVADARLVRRWVARLALAAASAPGMWLLTVWLAGREAPGSALLTAAGIVALIVLAIALRARSGTSGATA